MFSTGMELLFDDNDLVTHVVPNSGTGHEHKKGNDSKVCDSNKTDSQALKLNKIQQL